MTTPTDILIKEAFIGKSFYLGGRLINNIAGLGAKGVGKALGLGWKGVKGTAKATAPLFNLGGKAVGLAGAKTYEKVLEPYLRQELERAPIGFPVKSVVALGMLPYVTDMTGSANYFKKLEQPTIYRQRGEFGRSYFNPYETVIEKASAENSKMNATDILIKEASIKKKFVEGLGGGMEKVLDPNKDTWQGLKEVLGWGALGAGSVGAGYMAYPTAKSIAENLRNKLLPVSSRIDSEGEVEKIRLQHLGEYKAKQDLKKLEQKDFERESLPQIENTYHAVRQNDPLLNEASRDKTLRRVMDQTLDSVKRFAPSLAQDHRTLQSVLTEAVTSPDGGLSFQTIKSLAEAQKSINQAKG